MQAPRQVLVAAALLAVEGAALVVLGAVYAVAGLAGAPTDRLATLLAAAASVALGLLVLLVLASGVRRLRGGARSPAVVLQLLALPVGSGLVQGRVWVAAAVVLGLAGGVIYHLATPEAREAFRAAA